MNVYVTKFALTHGIYRVEVRECESQGMVAEINAKYPTYYHVEGRDWHRTWKPALDRALEMRENKLASLRKRIEKLEKMKFQEPQP